MAASDGIRSRVGARAVTSGVAIARRRLTLSDIRAALWTVRALRTVERQLSTGEWDAVTFPQVPSGASAAAGSTVESIVARSRAKCLPRALVRQRWLAAQGEQRDLIIGVTAPSAGFAAHAWLEGDPECHSQRYQELLRRPA